MKLNIQHSLSEGAEEIIIQIQSTYHSSEIMSPTPAIKGSAAPAAAPWTTTDSSSSTTPQRVLVADLPMMWPSDFCRFEKEGGIWGKQFQARRRQVTIAGQCAVASMIIGSAYVIKHKNTASALFSTVFGFGILGFSVGMAWGNLVHPPVANLSEVSMMRRVWWGKECAKHFDYSQINKDKWVAQYPHAKLPR